MTNNGMELAMGVVLCLIGLACLAVAIRQYRQKGPVCSAAYFSASKEEQGTLRTKKAYRYAGNVFLYGAIIALLLGISFLLDQTGIAFVGVVLAAGGALSGFLFMVAKN